MYSVLLFKLKENRKIYNLSNLRKFAVDFKKKENFVYFIIDVSLKLIEVYYFMDFF